MRQEICNTIRKSDRHIEVAETTSCDAPKQQISNLGLISSRHSSSTPKPVNQFRQWKNLLRI